MNKEREKLAIDVSTLEKGETEEILQIGSFVNNYHS